MRKMMFITATAVAVLMSGAANAAKVFTVNGTFAGGGTLTGTFTTNDALTSVTAFNLVSTTNTVGVFTFLGTNYTDSNATSVTTILPLFTQIAIGGANTKQLLLAFNPNLTASGASFSSASYEFQTFAGTRALSGTVTAQTQVGGAVPEPATWAMMIGGFGLVGGAMRYRRKRMTVTFA